MSRYAIYTDDLGHRAFLPYDDQGPIYNFFTSALFNHVDQETLKQTTVLSKYDDTGLQCGSHTVLVDRVSRLDEVEVRLIANRVAKNPWGANDSNGAVILRFQTLQEFDSFVKLVRVHMAPSSVEPDRPPYFRITL